MPLSALRFLKPETHNLGFYCFHYGKYIELQSVSTLSQASAME